MWDPTFEFFSRQDQFLDSAYDESKTKHDIHPSPSDEPAEGESERADEENEDEGGGAAGAHRGRFGRKAGLPAKFRD